MKHHDSIMVVVDKLTKTGHLIPVKTTHKVANIAEIDMKLLGYMEFRSQLFHTMILSLPPIFGHVCSKDLGQI
jgi:hypothetical protein